MTKQISPVVLADKTMDLLWTRVRQRGDLPGFASVVGAIVGAMQADDDREFNMVKTVLSDPTLTQRVLRLANSAMYSAFGQGINTVSKAVIVLGTETIGHLALGLKLIDGLSAALLSTSSTRTEMEKAVLAGQIARQVAASSTRRDTEEAVVCSMLHSLGRLMVSFYLPEQWERMQARADEQGMAENEAAREILGLGLDEVGSLIGKRWGFPQALVASLKEVPPRIAPGISHEPLEHSEWLAAISSMSTRCASLLCEEGQSSPPQDLRDIAENYAEMLGLDAGIVLAAIDTAQQQMQEETLLKSQEKPAGEPEAQSLLPIGKPVDAINILRRGVGDMRDAVMTTGTSQSMAVALETVYQGLGLSRAVTFLRNHEEGRYAARMCFGECTQELLPRLIFNDAYQPDVFHAALANDKMILVDDAQAPDFINKLPRWWRDQLGTSRSFIILPLMLNFHPVGLIYGDWNDALPVSKISVDEMALLDELRVLSVKAIERRCHAEPAWARAMN